MTINAPSDPIVSLVAGASAGLAVDIALYPLDTLKTRLQSPLGFFKSGGFRGIYRGISAAAIGSAPSAALFFLAYDSCKHIAGHLLSAWIGELSACLVRVPTDNVKQKIQAGVFRDMKSAISGISGIRGFFTGYWTTVAREIPFAGVQFPLYEYLKNQMEVDAPISGAIAGGVAAFVSTPLDVAKTRQMIEVRTDKYVGRSMWHVLRTIYNEEGMRKLFSGASARVAWISIGGFVFFGAYETVRKSLLRGKDKEERSVAAVSPSMSASSFLSLLLLLLTCLVSSQQPPSSCDFGQYAVLVNSQYVCVPCPAGYYQNPTLGTTCSACTPGKFTATDSSLFCANCPEREFNNADNSTSCSSCPVNQYNLGTGNTACTACPLGSSYNVGASQYNPYCRTCPGGSYGLYSGTTPMCVSCPAGTFNPAPASYDVLATSFCNNCTAGKYSLSYWTSCQTCANGRFAALNNSATCTNCPTGRYSDGSNVDEDLSVIPDPIGSFCKLSWFGKFASSTASVICTMCAAGRFADTRGAAACTNCPAGSFRNATSGLNCTLCSPGKFANATSSGACLNCPLGRFNSSFGASMCSNCTIGSYNDGSNIEEDLTVLSTPPGTVCKLCWNGKFSNSSGASTCFLCPQGRFNGSRGSTMCSNCSVGLFKVYSTDVNCSSCSPGFYNPVLGSSTCLMCPQGSYNSSLGASVCSNCSSGFAASKDVGASSCTLCSNGTFSSQDGQTVCSICVPGRFSTNVISTFCDVCPVGKFNNASNSSICQDCDRGKFSNLTESRFCSLCFEGTSLDVTGRSVCEVCDPGKSTSMKGSLQCDSCIPGRYSDGYGLLSCITCPRGRSEPSFGSNNCSFVCDFGEFSMDGSPSCQACAAGKYQPFRNSSVCFTCEAGFYSNSTKSLYCSRCPSGKYSSRDASSCIDCPSGKYTLNDTSAELSSCILCEAGKYGIESRTCSLCEKNTYSNEIGRNKSCEPCPPYSFTETVGSKFLNECVPCPGGYKMVMNGIEVLCEICGFHQYANGSSTECEWCPKGFYTEGQGKIFAECIPCESGKLQVEIDQGNRNCEVCPLNHFSGVGWTNCTTCPQAKYTPSNSSSTCIDCDIGYRLSSTTLLNRTCDPCPRNSYNGVQSSTMCLSCPVWAVTAMAASIFPFDCIMCPSGRFINSFSVDRTCEDCPLNTFSRLNSTFCSFCPTGKFTNNRASDRESLCIPCSPGRFSNSTNGDRKCEPCPKNYYSSISGSTVCQQCFVGFFTNTSGDIKCISCDFGYFYANDTCNICPVNSFSNSNGETSCTYCPLGTTNYFTGSSFCSNCDPGYFKSSPESACKMCLVNTITRYPGRTYCDSCAPGRISPNNGSTSCFNCALGKYRSFSDTECIACPFNHFASQLASFTCTLCPVGYHAPATGSSNCTECPDGSLNLEAGTPCLYKSYVNSEASLLLAPSLYSFYMIGTVGIFCYYGMNLRSSLTISLMSIDFLGNLLYAFIVPFYSAVIRYLHLLFSFMTITSLLGYDIFILMRANPIYEKLKIKLKSCWGPFYLILGSSNSSSENKSTLGCYSNRRIIAYLYGALVSVLLFPLYLICFLVTFVINFKVFPCGLFLYSSNLIVLPRFERWYFDRVMSKAIKGTYDFSSQIDDDSKSYSNRLIHLFSMHVRFQAGPCLVFVIINSIQLKYLGGFSIFKIFVSVITFIYGLYFIFAHKLSFRSEKRITLTTNESGITSVVNISALSADEKKTPPEDDLPPPPPPPLPNQTDEVKSPSQAKNAKRPSNKAKNSSTKRKSKKTVVPGSVPLE